MVNETATRIPPTTAAAEPLGGARLAIAAAVAGWFISVRRPSSAR